MLASTTFSKQPQRLERNDKTSFIIYDLWDSAQRIRPRQAFGHALGFVRELPASALNTAAYVTLNNPNPVDKVVVAVSTPVADAVMFHKWCPQPTTTAWPNKNSWLCPRKAACH